MIKGIWPDISQKTSAELVAMSVHMGDAYETPGILAVLFTIHLPYI